MLSLVTDNRKQVPASSVAELDMYYSERRPAERFQAILPSSYDPAGESSDDHRDRLFLQVLVSLAVNIVALIGIFYFLMPLTESGRDLGGRLLWGTLFITLGITAIFLRLGWRVICTNLLLLALGGLLVGASFVLGGVMSPTMIFLLAIPVLAATLMHSRWAYLWTTLTVVAWLLVLILEQQGVEMSRITRAENVGVVQLISLLGTVLVVMAVLGSYVAANTRLHAAMEQQNQHLDRLASRDALTGIANRRVFFEHAQRCLYRACRSGKPFALLVIDLNDFKQINDSLGHKTGDAVLQHFAQRLAEGFRETDYIGRLGGDEFGVVLEPAETREIIDGILQRFRQENRETVTVDGRPVHYTWSVGIAQFPGDGGDILALYEAADAAMYRAKRQAPPEFLWK